MSPTTHSARAPSYALTILLLGMTACGESTPAIVDPGDPIPERLEIAAGQDLVGVVGSRSSEPITVRVLTRDGIPVSGTRIVFAITSGDATVEDEVVTTDANGTAFTFVTFGNTAGAVQATATAQGLTGSPATFNLTAVAADASQISIVSGDNQTGTVAAPLANPLVAQVADMYGNAVAGTAVDIVVASGGGTTDPAQVTTADDGVASTTWTLGTAAGLQHLEFTISGGGSPTVEFSAVATADVAAKVSVASGNNQGGAAGEPLTDELIVRVDDQYDNPVSGESVHFELVVGDGAISPADVQTDAQGLAAANLTLGTAGDHTVEATVGTLTPATFVAKSFPPATLDPLTKTISTVELTWSGAPGADFERYELRRSLVSPVTEGDELVASIADPATTTHSDNTVEIGTRYFYRLYVYYTGGFRLVANEQTVEAGVSIELMGIGWDMAQDAANDRLFVSVPSLNQVTVISTTTFEIVDNIFVGSGPRGIDLSLDGQYLFAALNGAGSVAVVDLSDNSVDEILIGNELGDDRTYDVLMPKQDVLVVTSSPGSNGFAYVVRVDLDFVDGHTAGRIANNRIIRATPTLGMGPNGDFVYVGEGFSPNSLYKLDMNTAGNPIVLEDDHGSVSGTTLFDVNPDGSRIYLRSGQVIRTGSFNQAGIIAGGVPLVNADGSLCFVGKADAIEVFSTTTFLQVDEAYLPAPADRMTFIDGETALLVLADDIIYGVPVP